MAYISAKNATIKALLKKLWEDAMTIVRLEVRAKKIIKEAQKNAEDKVREAKLEIKEETILAKNRLDEEISAVKRNNFFRKEY